MTILIDLLLLIIIALTNVSFSLKFRNIIRLVFYFSLGPPVLFLTVRSCYAGDILLVIFLPYTVQSFKLKVTSGFKYLWFLKCLHLKNYKFTC